MSFHLICVLLLAIDLCVLCSALHSNFKFAGAKTWIRLGGSQQFHIKQTIKQPTKQLDEQTLWRSSHVFTLIFSPNLILTAAVKRALPASHTNEQTERTDGRADERICKQNVSMGGIMIIRLVIQDFSLFQSHFELHGVSDFGLGGCYPWTRRYVFLSADSKLCRSVPLLCFCKLTQICWCFFN